jgi:succinate-semialdehyde dehydrogenase/glutarate-semialdehyde dehydrogenase
MNYLQIIAGGEVTASDSGTYEIRNPADTSLVASAPQATRADTHRAINAAHAAFPAWSRTDPWQRSAILRRAAETINAQSEAIATAITRETGKPLAQAKGEVTQTVELFDWCADEARRIYGQILAGRTPNTQHQITHEPVGVVAAFTAWNFPVLLMSRKIAPALAAGCTIICRPADEAPGGALIVAKCLCEAGVPEGVVNVLTGLPQEISKEIMADPRVRKISFTGSIPVGTLLARAAADTIKRVTLELGGHAPVIVHSDVDPVWAAKQSATAKFRNSGQVCASPTRFLVHKDLFDTYLGAFVVEAENLILGDGMDSGTDMGPLINMKRLQAVEELVEDARERGATIATGGRRSTRFQNGYFYEPTVIVDAPPEARVMQEEPFGPIALINRFTEVDEAIRSANQTEFGLAAYVLTGSLELAQTTTKGLEAGVIGVNSFVASSAETPFGGVKQSGYGREGGPGALSDYLSTKYVNLNF